MHMQKKQQQQLLAAALALFSAATATVAVAPRHLVWPPPQRMRAAGPPLPLHPQVRATAAPAARCAALPSLSAPCALAVVTILILSRRFPPPRRSSRS